VFMHVAQGPELSFFKNQSKIVCVRSLQRSFPLHVLPTMHTAAKDILLCNSWWYCIIQDIKTCSKIMSSWAATRPFRQAFPCVVQSCCAKPVHSRTCSEIFTPGLFILRHPCFFFPETRYFFETSLLAKGVHYICKEFAWCEVLQRWSHLRVWRAHTILQTGRSGRGLAGGRPLPCSDKHVQGVICTFPFLRRSKPWELMNIHDFSFFIDFS